MSTTISGTNGVTFPDSTSMQTGQQACKAWVNFNGTGTVAIRDAYNVSSITDNGTGNYTVNFTTAMTDTNYSVSGSSAENFGGNFSNHLGFSLHKTDLNTGNFQCNTRNASGGAVDHILICAMVFR